MAVLSRIVLFIFLFSSTSVLSFGQADEHGKDKKDAVNAALKWLELVDAGSYVKSWGETAEFFKATTTKENWDKTLSNLLPEFGENQSRKVYNSRYLTKMPGGPIGEYVMVRFKSTFSKNSEAVETVTSQKGENGKWHVCGYFIK